MPSALQQRHLEDMARLRAGGAPHLIGKAVEVTGRRKDGGEFPIELSLARWQTDEGVFYTGILRDIAEAQARRHSAAAAEGPLRHAVAD
ncbi:MAG: PAS domain S-box protein [Rhodocyclaceae bacterium]|nr:PAS domain S-box protein [Rhodocyclaceae bacterium]